MIDQKKNDGHRQEGGAEIAMYAGVGIQNGQATLCISAAGYIIEEGGAKCLDLFIVHAMADQTVMDANRVHAGESRWSVSAPKRVFRCDTHTVGKKPIVITINCVRGQQPYAVIRDAHGGVTDNGDAPEGSTIPVSSRTKDYVLEALNRYAGYDMFMPLHPEAAQKERAEAKAASNARKRAKKVAKAKAKAKAEAIASGKRVVQYSNGRTHVRKVMLYAQDGARIDTTERWGWQEAEKASVHRQKPARKAWQSPASHGTRIMTKRQGNVALAFSEAGV